MSTRTPYDRALSLERSSHGAFALLALAAHLAGAGFLSRNARAAVSEPPPVVTEVEFVAPPPPAPVPPVVVREDRPVTTVATAATARAPAARPSAPAKASALLTATGPSDGPVSFATDPTGSEYGTGGRGAWRRSRG